jgi:hypothetical protein
MPSETLIKVDIVSTVTEGGEIRANLGQGEAGTVPDATIWGIDGFVSRPNDADADGACMGLYASQGNQRRIIATKDNRYGDKLGEFSEGDRGIITATDARLLLKKSNSSIQMVTLNNGEAGSIMLCQLNGQRGEYVVMVGSDNGAKVAQIKVKSDKMFLGVSGGGSVLIDMQGVTIGGSHFAANTKSGNLGTLGPVAPVAPAQSIMLGVTGMAATPAPFWTVSNA